MMPVPWPATLVGSQQVAREQSAWPVETPPPDAGSPVTKRGEPRESAENTAEMQNLASSFQSAGLS